MTEDCMSQGFPLLYKSFKSGYLDEIAGGLSIFSLFLTSKPYLWPISVIFMQL